VNFCEPEGKCGQNAKCIPQEKGDYKCVCKDGYGLAAGFSQSKPSDPVECVDYCAEGQEGYLRRVENGSPYLLCHGTPDKFPYYELTCAKGSVLKNGVCVKDCLCQKDSTECVVDYVNFEHTCKCRPGFEKVPESVLHCKPIYEKVSSIRLREHQVGERRRFASMSIDQCSTYSEPGYIIDGNTGDIDDFDVLYNLPHQLAEEMVVQTGTFDVEFALAKKPDSLVVRHVTVRPVDRCLTQYSNCGIQCQPNMICTPRVGSDYPRDINCSCPQPKGCHNWQDARLSVDEKDKAFYDFVSTHHEKHTHSTINRDRCTDTHYVGNLPNETVCVDVAPPVIFLLGDNPTFLTSCIVCFDDHHPNSTHTDYTDKGAISYDYFDGEKKELKGHLQGTIRPV